MALCVPITKYRQIKKLRDDAVQKIEDVTKTCCIPLDKYRYMKRVHGDAVKKLEEITKEFDELKETTQEYKEKYEDLMKKMENPGSMSLAGVDEADGGKLLLEEEAFKEEAVKQEQWPNEMKVKDLAKMSMEFMHSGERRSAKDRRSTLKGTLSSKPLEVTIVNLSKKTTLQMGASFFKSGRFSSQPTGSVEAGESQTYTISSKDGRAKTGVKGGLAFIVYDVKHEEEPIEEEEEEEKQDEMNGEKKNKKKSKKEKKEKKRKEKKSKKEKKKAKEEAGEEQDNKEADAEENKEENPEENPEEIQENGGDLDDTIPEENEDGETVAENKDEENPKDVSLTEEHKEEEDLPDGNGDFFICAFESPLAGNPKAKCNKTESKDILPVVKQIKNDKPSQQEMFGHYKFSRRHFVFVWKDDDTEW